MDRNTDEIIIENDLTDEEIKIIEEGRKEYIKGGFVPFEDVK